LIQEEILQTTKESMQKIKSSKQLAGLTISSVGMASTSGIAYARENGPALLMICFAKMQLTLGLIKGATPGEIGSRITLTVLS
jgi:hypothetical protein